MYSQHPNYTQQDSNGKDSRGGPSQQTTTTKMTGGNGAGGDSSETNIDKTKLIVNYVPQYATEEDLATLFSQIGPLENVRIMRDYKTGYSFGFGFVKYMREEDAAKAIDTLNGLNFRNKRLKVSYSRPPGHDMKDSNLYITNLPKDVTEEDIDRLFGEFGEIVQRTVLKDKITGMPRGVAFVRYSKGEQAQAAILGLDGKQLENAMLPLNVRVAEDHGRQKAQFIDNLNQSYMYSRGYSHVRNNYVSYRDGPNSSAPVGRGSGFAGRAGRYQQGYTNNGRFMGAGDNMVPNSLYW